MPTSEEAQEAADRAQQAELKAQQAKVGAEQAELGARDAEAEARDAEAKAELAEEKAESAAAAALEVLPDDDPLVDPNIHEFAAGADEEHPFGEAGAPVNHRSPFIVGFVATLGVLLAIVLARAVQLVSSTLVLIVIAAFLAIGLNPAVEFLQRRGWSRGRSAALVMGGVLLFFSGFVAAAVPPVVAQVGELREELPGQLQELRNDNQLIKRLDAEYGIIAKAEEAVEEQADAAPERILGFAKGVLTVIVKTLTILILTLYFIGSYDRIKRGALWLAPRSRRPRLGLLLDEILSRVGGYVLGNLATSVVAGIVSFIWFMALDVPYPLALAMLVAIFDLIPLVGATIAAVVGTLVAFFVSVPVGIATLVFFVVYQQLENYVIVPRVMKRTVDVSPLATVLAALVGGTLLGVLGALLAVPTAAAISLIGSEVVRPRQDKA